MYLKYFGLERAPFAITPDPGFVFLSSRHEDALAHLVYGVSRGGGGGFVQLTGEVGTGKTTLCRLLLEQVPERTHVALILNPAMTPKELVASALTELEVPFPSRATHKKLVDTLNQFLLKAHADGERVVLIIDEAQNLTPQALEQVRLLTNLETATEKLLQIILIGQPELRDLLRRRDLRQLSQRVTARYHLQPLDRDETAQYIEHRLKVAGAQRSPFSEAALRSIHRRAQGTPRLINIIAERSLLAAYASDRDRVSARLAQQAADEVLPARRAWKPAVAVGVTAALLIGSASALIWSQRESASMSPVNQAAAEPVTHLAEGSGVTSEAISTPPDWRALTHADMPQAGAALASLWGVQAPNPGQCRTVPAPGWRCAVLRGNSNRVRQLDRPALLRVQGEPSGWLLVHSAGPERATLAGPDAIAEVAWSEIDARWNGEFRVLFSVSEQAPTLLQPDQSHSYVAELRELLGVSGSGERYDSDLQSAVRQFQQQAGLSIDGAIGTETLLVLTSAQGITGPRLQQPDQSTPMPQGNH